MRLDDFVAAAAAATADVLRAVPADRLGAPTPCRDWDVRALTNHLRQVLAALDLAGRGGPVPAEHWTRPAGGDFDAMIGPAVAAWAQAPELVAMGEMKLPGEFVATMLGADLVLHGWDLARATGQDVRWPDDVAQTAYRFVAGAAEQGRSMGAFGEPVPVGDDAPPLERALGLSGRDPAWTPPTG